MRPGAEEDSGYVEESVEPGARASPAISNHCSLLATGVCICPASVGLGHEVWAFPCPCPSWLYVACDWFLLFPSQAVLPTSGVSVDTLSWQPTHLRMAPPLLQVMGTGCGDTGGERDSPEAPSVHRQELGCFLRWVGSSGRKVQSWGAMQGKV